jgi:lactosylceramide 4-alpha-galactosyltransferase
VAHLSDVLRLLTLWKYGGTYLDLDVIVQKQLDSIPENYVGMEFANSVCNCVINVDKNGTGHKLMEELLK